MRLSRNIRRLAISFIALTFTVMCNYLIKFETGYFCSYEFLILFASVNYYGLLSKEEDIF